MKEELFKKFLKQREIEEHLKQHIADIELQAEPYKNELKTLQESLDKLKENLIHYMNDNGIATKECEGYKIIKSVRETIKIVDHDLAIKNIFSPKLWLKIGKYVGKSQKVLKEELVVVTESLKKDRALEIYEYMKKGEGVEIPGFEVQSTQYLTVK